MLFICQPKVVLFSGLLRPHKHKFTNSLIERTIVLENVDPRDIYGSNNKFLTQIKSSFPELKITARGHNLKINGEPNAIEKFEDKIEEIIQHLNRYNSLSINQLERLLKDEMVQSEDKDNDDNTILYGVSGQAIKARTLNQREWFVA